jgi:glycosyltransferase involved in cell wall biosynthesis
MFGKFEIDSEFCSFHSQVISENYYKSPNEKHLKILYLSYDGLTDPLGQSQILPYLIGLAKKGHSITILSAEKKANYVTRKSVIESLIKDSENICWEKIFYTKTPPVLSTLTDIRQLQKKAEALHKKKQFQVVHCRSYITALVGEKLQQKFGLKFIFDMRGFWADERVEGGLWNLKNPVYKKVYQYFKRKEKDFLQKADYVISLTYKAKDEILSWEGLKKTKIQVIPCCSDTELFNSEKIRMPYLEKLWKELHIQPEEFVISYLGSLGTWYMTEEMLLFFRELLRVHPDAKFLFITPDSSEIVLEKARQLGIEERYFIFRKAERKEVPALLKLSQISLFFVKPSFSKKASSPTKMGEILSMGIPVICNTNVGDNEYLFKNYTCGWLLPDFSEESIKTAISQTDNLLKIDPETLRKTATTYFDLQKGIELYHEVYEGLGKKAKK